VFLQGIAFIIAAVAEHGFSSQFENNKNVNGVLKGSGASSKG
jgi:hypothetical protein